MYARGDTPINRIGASGLFDADFYALSSPAFARLGDRAIAHYHLEGWRDGRKPNFYFDGAWYLATNADVRAANMDPLLHYIDSGEAEGRRPCPVFDPVWYGQAHAIEPNELKLAHFLRHRRSGEMRPIAEFDPAYYLATYPDIEAAGIDPFEHYLVQGFREARRPFPEFDPTFYRHRYLRDQPDTNPLLHFISHKSEAGIHPSLPQGETTIAREIRRCTQPSPYFETVQVPDARVEARARVLAYYLPQYHAIPENDAWWGDGFTEWTNLARAVPRFAGHYQPRVPRDLGHYRLDAEAAATTLRRQIALARAAFLAGFVFYFYWFNGRRLLDGPLETLLADRTLDFPFCLMWTNENWTRKWDGQAGEVLIAQDHSTDDEDALMACLARHFADPRYIRVQGRPLLMVYRPSLIPDVRATVARWRARLGAGGDDPILIMSQAFGERDPRVHGFDAAVEFPPHKICDDLGVINPHLDILDSDFTAQVYDYEEVAAASVAEEAPDYPLIKTIVPSWDNDARRQGAGLVLHGSTPAAYEAWLESLVLRANAHPVFGEAIVCVNAWNEWAEGAYLEPDIHHGAAFLNATGRAITGAARPARLLLVGHDALAHGAQLLLLALARRLARGHGLALSILLLGGGRLEADYAACGSVTVLAADDPALDRHVASLRRDGVVAAVVNSLASGAICARLGDAGIAVTLLAHEMPGLLRDKGLMGAAGEAVSHATRIVVAADDVGHALARALTFDRDRVHVQPQGMYRARAIAPMSRDAARAALGLAPADTMVLGLGYADLRKGFDIFLQLWRMLREGTARKRRPIAHFVWAGGMDPGIAEHLGPEIEAAVATGRFTIAGYVEDPGSLLEAADCLALTSREDPFPSVVLEAMACGLPTIAFEGTGGIPGLLRRHDAGTVVPRADLEGFAHALALASRRNRAGARDRLGAIIATEFDFAAYAHRIMRMAEPERADISVVVPSYNYAAYMAQRLTSIFRQSHPVREVIVLDDASTDGSVDMARATADAQARDIEIEIAPVNGGNPFAQWRRACERAQGAWLWIAEADDAADPRFLATLASTVATDPAIVLAFTDSRIIDAAGAPHEASYRGYYRQSGCAALDRSGVHAGPDFIRDCLAERNMILNASAVLFRRQALLDAIDRCGCDVAGLDVAGDWRIYVEMLADPKSRVAFVASSLNVHRRHAASATHRLTGQRHVDEIEAVQGAIVARLGLPTEIVARQERYRAELRQHGMSAPTATLAHGLVD